MGWTTYQLVSQISSINSSTQKKWTYPTYTYHPEQTPKTLNVFCQALRSATRPNFRCLQVPSFWNFRWRGTRPLWGEWYQLKWDYFLREIEAQGAWIFSLKKVHEMFMNSFISALSTSHALNLETHFCTNAARTHVTVWTNALFVSSSWFVQHFCAFFGWVR